MLEPKPSTRPKIKKKKYKCVCTRLTRFSHFPHLSVILPFVFYFRNFKFCVGAVADWWRWFCFEEDTKKKSIACSVLNTKIVQVFSPEKRRRKQAKHFRPKWSENKMFSYCNGNITSRDSRYIAIYFIVLQDFELMSPKRNRSIIKLEKLRNSKLNRNEILVPPKSVRVQLNF